MTLKVDSLQQLLLWRLAVAPDGGMFAKEISSKNAVQPSKRSPLIAAGYLKEEKKSPGKGRKLSFLQLTDKGWGWCQQNLKMQITSTSPMTKQILQGLLGILNDYFDSQDHTSSFGQLVQRARSSPTETLEAKIRRTCLELGSGQENVRIRIADLRVRLNEVARDIFDETLLNMERARELSLLPLDDPREITPADREGELKTPAGHVRHIVYFGGRGS